MAILFQLHWHASSSVLRLKLRSPVLYRCLVSQVNSLIVPTTIPNIFKRSLQVEVDEPIMLDEVEPESLVVPPICPISCPPLPCPLDPRGFPHGHHRHGDVRHRDGHLL